MSDESVRMYEERKKIDGGHSDESWLIASLSRVEVGQTLRVGRCGSKGV